MLIKNHDYAAAAQTSNSSSYSEHYGSQIGRNIELKIESVHIRYEDRVLRPSQPLSLGLVIKYLQVGTTDHAWKSTYASHYDETTYKVQSASQIPLKICIEILLNRT